MENTLKDLLEFRITVYSGTLTTISTIQEQIPDAVLHLAKTNSQSTQTFNKKKEIEKHQNSHHRNSN